MKKTVRRLKNIIWSLVLSVAIVTQSTAGSAIVYATETVNAQTLPGATEVTEEAGEPEESEEGQENPDGNEDKNNNEDSDADDKDTGNGDEGDSGEAGDNRDDSDEKESDENDDDNSGKSEDDENNSDDKDSDVSEGEADESDEELDEEETDSENEEDASLAKELFGDIDLEQLKASLAELDEWAKSTGRIPNGYHDIGYEAGGLTEPVRSSDDSFPKAARAAAMPAQYDARAMGQVSSVKNQGNWGTCWSFSAINSAESAYKILNGSEVNLSESHLVNFFYNGNSGIALTGPDGGLTGDITTALTDVPVQQGGNSFFTTFALANWTGTANEATNSSLQYPDTNTDVLYIDPQYAYQDAMHLENAYWIPISDKDSVKKAIMQFGTVGVSYNYYAQYDSDRYKYYYPSYDGPAVYYNPDKPSTNHAVAIVGWDDDFDKDNFKYTYDNVYRIASKEEPRLPEENGAWLIKNSWGERVSDGGFFWISYEDVSIAGETTFAFDFKSADNYDHNYQYDGSNGIYYSGSSSGITAAAVYTATGDQKISAVGVGFKSASTDYTVQVYTGLTNESNPQSGDLAAEVTGKTSFEGFYTIDIDGGVFIEQGEKFGIVVTARKDGGAYLFVDNTYDNGGWIGFISDTSNDKTYYKSGSNWYNAGARYNYTYRIKAYTKDIDLSDVDEARWEDRELQDDMLEEIAPQIYNGAEVEPNFNLVFDGIPLQQDVDYTVTYENESNKKVGTATGTIQGIGEYRGEIPVSFTIIKKAITADMISDVEGWTYDGTEHLHDIVVTNGGNVMAEGTDYTVKFSKTPTGAGTYTATVTAAKNSNYSGSAKKTFTIEKLDLTKLENDDITLQFDGTEYTGKEIKPTVTVKSGNNIIAAANYTVKYKDNKNEGTATVTVTGKSNCQGTVTKTFAINSKPLGQEETLQEGISVTVKSATYSGAELKPAVTVKDGKTTLKLNKDYTISDDAYANNTDATSEDSLATVTIKGIGNYSGTIKKPFTIAPQTVAANKIKAEAVVSQDETTFCRVTVSGKEIDEHNYKLEITDAATGDAIEDESKLDPNRKYNIKVTLRNNYQNQKNTPVVIKNAICKKSVKDLDVKIVVFGEEFQDRMYSCDYKGSACKPAVKVWNEEELLTTKAYSVSYANNVNAGTATITITGKGNYSGMQNITFTINPQPITDADLVITVPNKTYTGSEIKSPVTVKVKKKKLKAGTDYEYKYFNNVNVSYNDDENHTVKKGAEVTVTLKNYDLGEKDYERKAYFAINPVAISSVKLGTSYYKGGEEVNPTLTVKAGKFVLANNAAYTENDDYTAEYVGNTDVSTSKSKASVTVTGKNNFKGTKTVKYSVTKEPLSKAKVEGITNQIYSGSNIEINSAIKMTDLSGENIDINNTELYTVTYKNNKKVGTASITIKANVTEKCLYSGSVTKKFKITKAELADMLTIDAGKLSAKTYTGSKLTYTAAEIKEAALPKVAGDSPTYKISYQNNVNAGTATVTLVGNGNYQGTVKLDFWIDPCPMDQVVVTLQNKSVSLGQNTTALAKIKQAIYGKLKLKVKKDYTLSYVGSYKTGVAAVKLTGAGNYTGTKTISYLVIK